MCESLKTQANDKFTIIRSPVAAAATALVNYFQI